jgi:endonuclease-3
MKLEERVTAIIRGLRKMYPDAHCELDYKTPLELLVATILSAQCTDKRVNVVTKTLFKKYRTARDYARARTAELEGLVRSAGFFRSKAKSIQETAKILAARHGGRVPDTMEELLQLRGVARKTANVILGTAYGKACGIVVDTHIKRLAYRLGLTDETRPEKIEQDLMKLVPQRDWIFFGQGMVWHGRRVCFARHPDCPGCALNEFCPKRGV